MIEGAAHHLDLFFSNPQDPESVKQCRQLEVENIRKWINEAETRLKDSL